MVIAIDGPAGAGKSTVARGVARELGFTYLDSGAMYRAVALASLRGDAADAGAVARAADISLGERVLLDGDDVTAAIRPPEVTAQASRVAALLPAGYAAAAAPASADALPVLQWSYRW